MRLLILSCSDTKRAMLTPIVIAAFDALGRAFLSALSVLSAGPWAITYP
jgi:hypothetical protein